MKTLPYVLIAGHGRSGTNWLLEMFDLSARTFCRNEPYGIDVSPLAALEHDRFVKRHDQGALDRDWDEAVQWTATHMGERDRVITMPKDHMWPLARTLGVYRMVRGPKYRAALSTVLRHLRGGEWPITRLVFNHRRFEHTLALLNRVTAPGVADYVLHHRPSVAVYHIMRHPGGFLNSWASRYLAKRDTEAVNRLNQARLHDVVREHPHWAERFGDIDAMGVHESELWYWCYACETIHAAGRDKAHYMPIVYEDLASNAAQVIERCYSFCGLPWTDAIRAQVERAAQTSETIAANWRSRLNDEHIALVERVLESSGLKSLWTPEGMASASSDDG